MCLSTAYARIISDETVMLRSVQRLRIDGETVILTDLLERETRVAGRLAMADLVNGIVIIDTEEF
ncbi:MAG: CooT family nickel-binding protein [Oscillospiraceae bacterium]|jgi:predicted RNA-binding protein|nr:CooT family nickel-binding protein [Oscillospiraceae bacterium]